MNRRIDALEKSEVFSSIESKFDRPVSDILPFSFNRSFVCYIRRSSKLFRYLLKRRKLDAFRAYLAYCKNETQALLDCIEIEKALYNNAFYSFIDENRRIWQYICKYRNAKEFFKGFERDEEFKFIQKPIAYRSLSLSLAAKSERLRLIREVIGNKQGKIKYNLLKRYWREYHN